MDQFFEVALLYGLLIALCLTAKVSGIGCFECLSEDGNMRDCEDQFGPYNRTEHLYTPRCRVGYLKFQAFHCVKIKATRANGERLMIRTCSVEDWGTHCGDLWFDYHANENLEPLTGCMASCDFDGCNASARVLPITSIVAGMLTLLGALHRLTALALT